MTHITINTGDRQTLALTPENYDPEVLDRLEASLPHVPRLSSWSIERETPAQGAVRFWMLVGDTTVSENRVRQVGKGLELETKIAGGAERLTREQLEMLADLEQCAAIVLARQASKPSRSGE